MTTGTITGTAVAWLAGNLFMLMWHTLPTMSTIAIVGGLVLCAMWGAISTRSRVAWWMAIAGLSFLWTWFAACQQSSEILPYETEGQRIEITAKVITLPIPANGRIRFDASPSGNNDANAPLPPRIRLSYYTSGKNKKKRARLRLGDTFKATVKLKRPWSYRNPGGFDYEKYLFAKGIGATGYIIDYTRVKRGNTARQHIFDRLTSVTAHGGSSGAIAALSLGASGLLNTRQNELLIMTGTRHLFAVSGMHIGLVFGMAFFIAGLFWKTTKRLSHWQAKRDFASAVALPLACAYAWLTGLDVPAQRALVMLTCVCLIGWMRYRLSPGHALGVALIVILLVQPLGTLTISFWFSFVATATIIVYIFSTPSGLPESPQWRLHARKFKWIRLQCCVSLVMLVACMALFHQAAINAPLSNLWAIPMMSLLILPGCLLTVLLLPFGETVAGAAAAVTDFLFGILWSGLGYMTLWDFGFRTHNPPGWSLPLALAGVLALLFAYRAGTRAASLVLFLPLWFGNTQYRPGTGEFEVTFLDLGQGLSAVIRTQKQVVLFDTGIENAGYSAARRVVIPYLRAANIKNIERLVVSHGDNDHAGGIDTILASLSVGRKIASPEVATLHGFETCHAGYEWSADGVQFLFMHPPPDTPMVGNNSSCVLRIGEPGRCVLLTADIEAEAEHILTSTWKRALSCPVILMPHHGSATSSTTEFIAATNPEIAVVTSGRNNRYGFPLTRIVSRYERRGVKILNTAETGALSVRFTRDRAPCISGATRFDDRRYWHLTRPMRHNVDATAMRCRDVP